MVDSPVPPASLQTEPLARYPDGWTTGILLLGCVGLWSFAAIPNSYARMVGWPWSLLWQGAFLCIAWVGFRQLRCRTLSYRRLGAGLDGVLLALLLVSLLSSLTAEFPLLAVQQVIKVMGYVGLLYVLCNGPARWCGAIVLWRGMVCAGAIAAIVGLILWQPSAEMWLSNDFSTALRNPMPLGHHNFSGGFFVLVLPLAIRRIWCSAGWQRWGYGIASLALSIALYSTGSRGAWLGALTTLLVALAGMVLRSRQRFKTGLIAGCILLMVSAGLLSNPRIRTFLETASIHPGQVQLADSPALDRIHMARATANIVSAHPVLGVGPGNLGRLYDRYRPISAGTGLTQVQQVHNTPLNLVCELGLVGLMVYGVGLLCLLRLGWRLWHQLSASTEQALVEAVGLSLLGYGVSSLTDYQLENIPIALMLTTLVAVLVRLSPAIPSIPLPARRSASLLVLLVVGVALQFWLRTDLSLWFAHRGLHALDQGSLPQADARLYKAASLTPWDPTASALGAQVLAELVESAAAADQEMLRNEAITLYQQALTAAPNDPWFNQNLGVLLGQMNKTDAMMPAMARVEQLMPRSRNYSYYLLAKAYARQETPAQDKTALAKKL